MDGSLMSNDNERSEADVPTAELAEQLMQHIGDVKPGAKPGSTRKPQWNADELRMQLRNYNRTPFLDLIQHFLEAAPTIQDIEKLASRSPDKYIAALTQLARIGGFTEKTESTTNINLNVATMSDSQLEDELRKAQAELGITIEGTLADEVGVGRVPTADTHATHVRSLLRPEPTSES
jgi:hypothetical protein